MNKTLPSWFLLTAVLFVLGFGCKKENKPLHDIARNIPIARADSTASSEALALSSLAGKRVSCLTGSAFENRLHAKVPTAHIVYHNSLPHQILALEAGRIDAFLVDEPIWRLFQNKHPFFRRCKEMVSEEKYGFVIDPQRPELRVRLNAFLASLRDSGELQRLQVKWTSPTADHTMEPLPTKGSAGTLRVATVSTFAPFVYIENDQIIGYEIDLLSRFAR